MNDKINLFACQKSVDFMHKKPLSPTERHDWLRLSRAENVGPSTFRQLLRRFGSARAALDALPDIAKRSSGRVIRLPTPASIDDEIARTEKIGARIIAWCEDDYPEALAAIEDAPPLITVRGNIKIAHKRGIGIVGARNASLNGRKLAEILARDLGAQEITIVSGLARGIDTAAHLASLSTGTVAVVAGGADVIYPEENRVLYDKIANQGCIISDQPLGCEPHAKLFPRRNRIISGLSLGVVIVEAAMQSGSLITARMALEQGREVFAVPGSPLDPRCTGTNGLIRQGAVLVEKATDVLAHIHAMPAKRLVGFAEPPMTVASEPFDENELLTARDIVLEQLSPSPISIDELLRHCDLPAQTVFMVLLDLELGGMLERQAGQKVALAA
jgi:DNA processing protein